MAAAQPSRIAFIGIGNIGGGMAANQAKAGREIAAFDLSEGAVLARAAQASCKPAGSIAEAVQGVHAVITMLPAGHVRQVYGAQAEGLYALFERLGAGGKDF